MKTKLSWELGILLFAGLLALGLSAGAQQSNPNGPKPMQSYDVNREVSLVGTVIKFDAASEKPPIGAHLLLQTSSAQVDVHLGNGRVLQANHFDLNPGDSVRIVGENLVSGDSAIFTARIVQKSAQAVAVRNTKGFPLLPASAMTPAQKEALRGVR
jgi:hypothetical protein